MKGYYRFLLKLLIFISPIILIYVFIEHKVKSVPNNYSVKRMYFQEQRDSIEVLVLGSSHSFYGINPEFFSKKGFNLAQVNQSLYYDKALTLKYLPFLKKLQLVIIPVHYASFYYQLSKSPENWRAYFYLHYWGLKDTNTSVWDSRYYSVIMTYGNGQTFNYIKDGFETTPVDIRRSGWEYIPFIGDSLTINKKTAQERFSIFENYVKEGDFRTVTADMDVLLDSLKARGIETALVTLPAYKTFRNLYDTSIINNNRKEIDFLCSKYNCKYYDYLNDGRFMMKDFSDNDHLNYIGAEKLSKIINEDIIKKQ